MICLLIYKQNFAGKPGVVFVSLFAKASEFAVNKTKV